MLKCPRFGFATRGVQVGALEGLFWGPHRGKSRGGVLKKTLSGLLILAALAVGQTSQAPHLVIDNFKRDTLPFGYDPNGIGVGYVAWNHPSAKASIALTKTPPAQPLASLRKTRS